MISFRKPRMTALMACAAMLFATPAFAQSDAATDYFSFRNGADIVEYPAFPELSQMDSSPYNLMDDSPATDWVARERGAVFVLELSEETEISRLSFDTGNLDRKSVKGFTVEFSNTSADSGFEPVLSGTLRMNANNQSFSFKPEERPTGRWVRLTIQGNYGDEYTALTGFHGYGRQTTRSASIPDFTGNYDGASGLGWMHFRQDGNRVTGCYQYQNSEVSGTVTGRVMKLTIVETDIAGDKTVSTGYFQATQDGSGFRGLVRRNDPSARDAYASYFRAEKVSDNAGGC